MVNALSNFTFNFSFWLDLYKTYNHCVIQLATTDNNIRQKAIIDFGSHALKFTLGAKTNSVKINIMI